MELVYYQKNIHEKSLRELCIKRALFFPKVLPPRGLVIEGIAMEFYYLSDCGQLMIPHFFVTNPDVSKEIRKEAVKKIIDFLPELGKRHGVKWIWSATSEESSGFNDALKNETNYTYKCVAVEWRL